MKMVVITEIDCKDILSKEVLASLAESKPLDSVSMYARFFDESCAGWSNDSNVNLVYLRQQQNYANNLLKSRGHLFLNDVYNLLGIPKTKEGQVVGWVYDVDNPMGDNYVDFDIYAERNQGFVNGYKKSVLLDFNVDGCILDKI